MTRIPAKREDEFPKSESALGASAPERGGVRITAESRTEEGASSGVQRDELLEGEQVVYQSPFTVPRKALMTPALMLGGFTLFWNGLVWGAFITPMLLNMNFSESAFPQAIMMLFMIPFVAVGIFLFWICFRLIVTLPKCRVALTDRRALLLHPKGHVLTSAWARDLEDWSLEIRDDRVWITTPTSNHKEGQKSLPFVMEIPASDQERVDALMKAIIAINATPVKIKRRRRG